MLVLEFKHLGHTVLPVFGVRRLGPDLADFSDTLANLRIGAMPKPLFIPV